MIKGRFRVQAEKEERGRSRSSLKRTQLCQFLLVGSPAWRWFLLFPGVSAGSQRSLLLLQPGQVAAAGSSRIITIHPLHLREERQTIGNANNSEKKKHLSAPKGGILFGGCINAFCEPENQRDGVMPSARSLSDYALQAVHVFPFRSFQWGLCAFSVSLDLVSEAFEYPRIYCL